MEWWKEKRFRMIQNNLRDIDAGMDVDRYIEYLKEFEADVCMIGCGGITAFYPTELRYQKTSPYLKDDFFGNLLQKCHKNGIRVIARFDFSKTHKDFLEAHPEWFSRTLDGNPVYFNDTAAVCVNGDYQQQYSLKILEEVLSHYPVDGVFFNMFGYQTRDYDNHYVGICQCENCRKKFREYSNMELPRKENEEDPSFRKYKEFKKETTEKLLKKIYQKIKSMNSDVAVCTYNRKGVDLIRSESNSAVDRPLPFWMMASEENVAGVRAGMEDRYSSNCVINAVDIFYRFMGVSPWLNALRLYGNMASGENLDWCIIGGFETYPDRKNFEMVKQVFRFHKRYEKYLGNLCSCAKILLVRPLEEKNALEEFRGIFKLLKESHLLFDVTDKDEIENVCTAGVQYSVIILPKIESLSQGAVAALENSNSVLVGTGAALKNQPEILQRLFKVMIGKQLLPVRGSYFLTEPKETFKDFRDRDWVYLDKEYYFMTPDRENKNYLPLIRAGMYGPPERCQGYQITEQSSVSAVPGKSIYFPWNPGSLYLSHGYEDFKCLFLDVLKENTNCAEQFIQVEGPPCAEIMFDKCGDGQYLLQILNYSGFNGMTFFEPLKVELDIRLKHIQVERIQVLTATGKRRLNGNERFHLSVKGLYQAVLISGKENI